MLKWFLRLFPTFRKIESAAAALRQENNNIESACAALRHELKYLQDRVSDHLASAQEWKARSEHWEAEYQKANADAIKARETVADFISQLRFGKKIFEHAPALPDKPINHEPLPKARQQARVRVQQDEAEFARELQKYVSSRVDGGTPAAPKDGVAN